MAGVEVMSVTWDSHHKSVISVFDSLLKTETLVDCTLAAEGKFIKVHKIIISACSPYLKSLLVGASDSHPILILNDTRYSDLESLVEYMYKGGVMLPKERVKEFKLAAEHLQIRGLFDPKQTQLLKEGDRRERRRNRGLKRTRPATDSYERYDDEAVNLKTELFSEEETTVASDDDPDWEPEPSTSSRVEEEANFENSDDDERSSWRSIEDEERTRIRLGKKFVCTECGKCYKNESTLAFHRRKRHRGRKGALKAVYQGELPLKQPVVKLSPLDKCDRCEGMYSPENKDGEMEGTKMCNTCVFELSPPPKKIKVEDVGAEESLETGDAEREEGGGSQSTLNPAEGNQDSSKLIVGLNVKDRTRILCALCGQFFVGQASFDSHSEKVHTKQEVPKERDNSATKSVEKPVSQDRHIEYVQPNNVLDSNDFRFRSKFLCYYCGLYFNGLTVLNFHLGSNHKKIETFNVSKFVRDEKIRTPMANYRPSRPRKQKSASVERHSPNSLLHLCEFCGLSFKLFFPFKQHMLKHSTNWSQGENDKSEEAVNSRGQEEGPNGGATLLGKVNPIQIKRERSPFEEGSREAAEFQDRLKNIKVESEEDLGIIGMEDPF